MTKFIDSVKFQYYPSSVYETVPLGMCSLRDMLSAIQSPKETTLKVFKEIEEASKVGDKKLKDKLKSQLFYFNPCCVMDGTGRKYENIISYTGVLLVDIDNLDEDVAVALKKYLFDTYDFVIASFLSVSKKGVKILVRIPVALDVNDFKSYFYGLMSSWQFIKNMDFAPQNPSLPAYLTYDREILIRENPSIFNRRGIKVDEFKQYSGEKIEVEATEEDRETIIRILTSMMNKITDSGHYICRSTCILGWGYCGAGYFSEDEMQDILFDLIDSNDYLSQKPKSYKKTCLDMKNLGMSAPLTLEDNG
jgi:hypothetical protein